MFVYIYTYIYMCIIDNMSIYDIHMLAYLYVYIVYTHRPW